MSPNTTRHTTTQTPIPEIKTVICAVASMIVRLNRMLAVYLRTNSVGKFVCNGPLIF
jgi:hypothetical protein